MKKKTESNEKVDFVALVKKAKSDFQMSDDEILNLPSVKSLLRQSKSHKSIYALSFLFLLLICLPVTAIWSVYTGSKFGYFFANL